MGTTSEKLTYLNETKQELKQKINNLGGDITNQTTFRQYAEQLQNVYDNAPKTSYAEGSNITLSNTLKGKLDFEDSIVGYGDTEQETTEGYNMIKWTSTQNSIVTINNDGTITLNGTSIGFSLNFNTITLQANKTYSVICKLISGSVSAPSGTAIGIMSLLGNYAWLQDNVRNTYTPTSDTNRTSAWVAENAVFTNAVFQIWAYEGNIDKTYEPYTNGASPNPSYPQDIEVVRGKNLFDGELESGEYENSTGEKKTTAERYRNANYIKVSPNTTYTFSINGTSQKYVVYEYTNSKTFIQYLSPTTGTFTTSSTTGYINFRNYAADYTSDWANLKIQLEKRKFSYFLSTL